MGSNERSRSRFFALSTCSPYPSPPTMRVRRSTQAMTMTTVRVLLPVWLCTRPRFYHALFAQSFSPVCFLLFIFLLVPLLSSCSSLPIVPPLLCPRRTLTRNQPIFPRSNHRRNASARRSAAHLSLPSLHLLQLFEPPSSSPIYIDTYIRIQLGIRGISEGFRRA